MITNFDEPIDRSVVPALKVHPNVIGEESSNIFAASVADMDFRAAPPILEAMNKRLEHGIFGYEAVANELIPSLIAWQQNRYGWQINRDEILRSPNILNTLSMAVNIFSDVGEGVIIQPPVFFDFYDILQENHRKTVTNPLVLKDNCYRMDFDDLEDKAKDPQNKMLLLCNPHNPVGRVWRADELRQLGDICARHDVLVVTDEIHSDITFKGNRYIPFASLGESYAYNSITCISPAKSFNIASCCSAFAVIKEKEKRSRFQAENSRLTVNKNNAFANVAMAAAYQKGEPWLEAVIEYIEGNLGLIKDHITPMGKINLIAAEGTFLLWLDCRGLGIEPDKLKEFFRTKARWIVNSGEVFGPEGAGFVRVNIACSKLVLKKALVRLGKAVLDHASKNSL
ncbi:MAG: pyridoxal phosphate-dependent aminotransferase [Proteobacteria bacterium]|nr:pyridoxal phosphate-dependent aminotransferase [Pseudomonadota bacterium]